MTAVEAVLNQPVAQAIGWALVHFVWQGTVIAVATAIMLAALRRSAADVRYVVATIGLALMVTMPTVTAVQTWRAASLTASIAGTPEGRLSDASGVVAAPKRSVPSTSSSFAVTAQEPAVFLDRAIRRLQLEPWLPVWLSIWLCGVTLLTLRLVSGWLWVQRMKTRGTGPADATWVAMASRLSRRLHLSRPIRLLESSFVEVPTVIGWLKPVVLLPASALAGLSPHQLEAILAHELAHIRRHDYLVNLLQTLVETLLFYHPAVWWLSRRIRDEREHCCDDLAVSLCGDPRTYASALADLEELRGGGQLVIAATGGSLLHRVRRVLGAPTSHTGRAPAWLAGGVAILLMLTMATGAIGKEALSIPVRAASPPAAAAESAFASTSQESVNVQRSGRQRGNFTWSNNGETLSVNYEGAFEFTDDDRDVKSMAPGSYLKLSDGGWFGGRGVEFRADASGNITRRFRVGIVEKPYEPEGRAWLTAHLPRFIRQTGLGAPARVARIMKSQGPAGVLAEVSRMDGSWAKRVYFTELLKTPGLDAAVVRQALAQAGREMSSDHELATLLIASQRLLNDEASRKAYFDAATNIESDYEMRRVLSAGLKGGSVTPTVLASILASAATIQGDYEHASLLIEIATSHPLDDTSRRPFFTALDTVQGAYERGRVLAALGKRMDLSQETQVAMLRASAASNSDYEKAQFLLRMAKQHAIEGQLRQPFFAALETVHSAYERGRVLEAVAQRPDASPETILAVIRSAGAINGHHEKSQVLLRVAAAHSLTGPARDAYVTAAERLSEYEQGRVLAALVRNERGRRN